MDTFPRPFWWAAVERFTMGSDKCVHLIRRLLEPTVDHQARKHCNATVSVSTSNGRLGLGIPSDEEARQLVSSSFTQTLVEALPCHYAGGTAPFGNEWFWEGYRYGLFGENIIYDVDRAGIILSEDTLDEQKKFRLVANASLGIQISDSGVKPELGENSRALIHGSAKIDVLYSISLSVVLHVAQQPILDYEEGPQAVILCATKNECDEFTSVLNEFCSQLHLIVHNLFDPYPSIPTGKRADIVVGTPPLWDAVSPSLNVLGSAGGLEDLLDGLNKFSNPAWSSTTSRWRPYNLNSVAQLVIFDVELQVHSGYGGILKRILTVQSAAAPMLAHIAGLPLDCQFYVVRGGDRYTYSSMIIDVAHQTEEICRLVCSRGKQTGWETARLSVQLCEDSQLDADNRESELRAKQVLPSRKRCRSTSPQLENSHAERTVGRLHPQRSHGILIRNALSCSRLCVDASAYVELKEGVLEEAKRFWSSFDEVEHDKCMFELDIVAAKLAFLVFERSGADSPLDTAGRPPAELPLPHPEACLLIEPRKITDRLATRFELLFRHLEEKFNGEMFDGSIMSCLNLCDSQLDLTYILESTADLSIGELTKCSLMSYLTQLGITCGISPTDCRLQLSPYCVVLAYLERRDERESSLTLSASRDAVFDALRQKDCKEVVSQDNDKLVGLFSESLSTFETSIPLTTFLKSRTPSHPFTVVVLRNICCSSQELFMGEATPVNPTAKPLALFLLEECCQYGRVVSYCCFEQAAKPSESSPGVLRIGQEGALGSTSRVGMRTTSLFVEFESHFSAMEAVRLLRYRFEVDDDTVVGCRPRRVHLFRNALYYVGVAEIPQSTDDCDDLGMNLLAE